MEGSIPKNRRERGTRKEDTKSDSSTPEIPLTITQSLVSSVGKTHFWVNHTIKRTQSERILLLYELILIVIQDTTLWHTTDMWKEASPESNHSHQQTQFIHCSLSEEGRIVVTRPVSLNWPCYCEIIVWEYNSVKAPTVANTIHWSIIPNPSCHRERLFVWSCCNHSGISTLPNESNSTIMVCIDPFLWLFQRIRVCSGGLVSLWRNPMVMKGDHLSSILFLWDTFSTSLFVVGSL